MKEIKGLGKWKSIPSLCGERLNIAKMLIPTCRFTAIPVKISKVIFLQI